MGPRRLLVTDLDGTLLGDDEALERFAAWRADAGRAYGLLYATGRTRESVRRLVSETEVPEPDVVISLVGTEIHDRDGRPWPGWIERFDHWDAALVRRVLAADERLELQPEPAQSRLKASYFAPGLGAPDVVQIGEGLAAAGLATTILYSGDLYLDVIPAGSGKGAATRSVAAGLGLSPADVLTFGDSGNDVGLFTEGFRGTIVANASPELREVVDASVYRSPCPYADGVLDGIRHWSALD